MTLIILRGFLSPNFKIKAAVSFPVLFTRLMASIIMHLNLVPEIRQGLILAKYTVNHPWMFKDAFSEDGKIKVINVIVPFSIGISQAFIGTLV